MGMSQRARSLFVLHVVKVDGEVVMSGSKAVCESRARFERRMMRERGEKNRGRVVVEASQ